MGIGSEKSVDVAVCDRYRTYDPQTHRVSVVRAPIFREEACLHPSTIFKLMEDSSDDDSPAPDSAT